MSKEISLSAVYHEVVFILPECFPDGSDAGRTLDDLDDTLTASFPFTMAEPAEYIYNSGGETITEEGVKYTVLVDSLTQRDTDKLMRIVMSTCKTLQMEFVYVKQNNEVKFVTIAN